MKNPGLNPSGNPEKHGPFAAFVGADATSIWAAATSGGPSIAIHLLGCLLARTFRDLAKSIPAMVELVHERQREIKSEANAFSSTASHVAALMAAEQPIQRDELQQWDTSARAWLQTADSAMQKEYVQLKLILQNISLPVTSGVPLYDDVVRAWCQAMNGLERHLNGGPQSVTDGAILLAISAWHLYPNLLVLGSESVKVDFGNGGIQSSSLLTVRITNVGGSRDEKDGIYWSMALSHYRYYGRALKVVGEVDDRLTIEQLHLVAFGSLMFDWNVSRNGLKSAAKWLTALKGYLSRTELSLGCPSWLCNLVDAASVVMDAGGAGYDEAMALIAFGQRRGTDFLHPRGQPCLPWFGLRFRHILRALSAQTPEESALKHLRSVASAGGLGHDEALITFIDTVDLTGKKLAVHEYYTANIPGSDFGDKLQKPTKTTNAAVKPQLEAHCTANDPTAPGTTKMPESEVQHEEKLRLCPSLGNHQTWQGLFSPDTVSGGSVKRIKNRVLTPDCVHEGTRHEDERTRDSFESIPGSFQPSLFSPLYEEYYNIPIHGKLFNDGSAVLPDGLRYFPCSPVRFKKYMGNSSGTMRLWLAEGRAVDECEKITEQIESMLSGASAEMLDMETATKLLNEGSDLNPLFVWRYLEDRETEKSGGALKEAMLLMRKGRRRFDVTLDSLRTLEVVKRIYNRLSGATVSASVVKRGFHGTNLAGLGLDTPATLSTCIVFSCIAFTETGKISLDPKDLKLVVALSSGNSLFVSTRLLADPFDEVDDRAVTRIVGNLGRPGLNLLIPPAASPLTRSLSSSFRAVTYAPFNGHREDNFKGTTLHLSFTSHKFPLDYGVSGIVDHQVFFVESVISVHDSGQWVADLDILKAFDTSKIRNTVCLPRMQLQKTCAHPGGMIDSALAAITSIDTWEEVLDTCPGINIIRAHKNWSARLATSIMLSKPPDKHIDNGEDSDNQDAAGAGIGQNRGAYCILENGDDVCWVCLHHEVSRMANMNPSYAFYIIA